MKLSGFVLDTSEAYDRCLTWAADGLLDAVYVQVEAWPHEEKNRGAFAKWKETLNPHGVKVYATLWWGELDSHVTVADRIMDYRETLAPQGWLLNIEKPYGEGDNVAYAMAASKPEPVRVSYNGLAEQGGFDWRRWSQRGAEVRGQCYDGDGDNTKGPGTPGEMVTSAIAPTICWGGALTSPAWWYRIRVGASFSWAYVVGLAGERLRMRRANGSEVWADGSWTGSHLEFGPQRRVWSAQAGGTLLGKVHGFAQYGKIGYALGTTRTVTPEKLVQLAKGAQAPGKPLVKRCDVYTLDNTTDEQLRALAAI